MFSFAPSLSNRSPFGTLTEKGVAQNLRARVAQVLVHWSLFPFTWGPFCIFLSHSPNRTPNERLSLSSGPQNQETCGGRCPRVHFMCSSKLFVLFFSWGSVWKHGGHILSPKAGDVSKSRAPALFRRRPNDRVPGSQNALLIVQVTLEANVKGNSRNPCARFKQRGGRK